MPQCLEYIWLDGQETPELRSKTKVLEKPIEDLKDIPIWNFDGSSTYQSDTKKSDLILQPVAVFKNPLTKEGDKEKDDKLVLCEVLNEDGTPHLSNTRSQLKIAANVYRAYVPWFGIEQEYTMMNPGSRLPYQWPIRKKDWPKQGRNYCGVGADLVFGRLLSETHLASCLDADLKICGTNSEVMASQWEFQVGPLPPLDVADELWVARWLLCRLGEDLGVTISFDPKPIKGWNGAGAHTNFSTKAMRLKGGIKHIRVAIEKLSRFHEEHIAAYGKGNERRLSGKFETSSIKKFESGESHRGASVRIPLAVAKAGCGYLEDRRPAANMDPYLVCNAILRTACGEGFKS